MARLIANRYEVLDRLGGGGMGQVFRARDTRLEREVAIKTVDSADADPTTLERFRREAVATAGLSDPHVVSIYDAGFDDGDAYIVMEKLNGPSLAERIRAEEHLSVPDTLDVALAVASGLTAAHKVGVVHRDIKPGNIMFHEDQIKIVDFGIAQLGQQHGAALTAPATAMGTAAYMSPEQAMGRTATEKSDWYALGCLLMAALTGTPPFRGEAIAVAQQQINAVPPRASQLRTGVPPALDDLIDRLLAKDPDQRPTSAEILRQVRALRVDPDAPTTLIPATPVNPTRVMPAAAPPPDRYAESEPEYEEIEEYDDGYDDRVDRSRRSPVGAIATVLVIAALAGFGLWFFVLRDAGPARDPSTGVPTEPVQTTEPSQPSEPGQEPGPTQEPTRQRPRNPLPTEFPKLPGRGDPSGDQNGPNDGGQSDGGQSDGGQSDGGQDDGGQDDGDDDGAEGDGDGSTGETKDQQKQREKIGEAVAEVRDPGAREQLETSLAQRAMTPTGLGQFRLEVEKLRFSGDLTNDEADRIIERL